jgi:hypothetical protein
MKNEVGHLVQILRNGKPFIETDHLIGATAFLHEGPEVPGRFTGNMAKESDGLH